MNFKDKKKPLAIFLAVMLLVTAFLFWDEVAKQEPETEKIEETESREPAGDDQESTIREKEKEEAVNIETTFWFWQGKESGTPSKEYLTLRGDGTYILTIELEGRDPEDVAGSYTRKGENGQYLQLRRDGTKVKGEIQGRHLTLEEKRYTKTTCEHT